PKLSDQGMKEFPLQGGVLVIAEIQIFRHQRCPRFSLQPQGKHGEGAGHRTGFIRKVLIPLKLPHSQTSVSLHSRMKIGMLHSTGKELIDSLFGQAGNRQIEFFFPTELHRVTAGKSLLRKHRTQVVQDFSITLLGGVPGGDADGSKHIIGRCGEMLRFTPLDVLWQFAAAARFQLLHHVWAELGNHAENVLGGEGVVAGSIYRITDRHIAGKAQQAFVHILRPQLGPHGAGRVSGKVILFLSNLKIPLLHL
ncbi:Sortase, partial [Dysosmobacter welbionis]